MSSSLLAGISSSLLFGLFMILGQLRDTIRGMLETRRFAGFVDTPTDIRVNESIVVSSLGVPGRLSEPNGRYMLLFVSDRCTTCFHVMTQLSRIECHDVVTVLNTRTPEFGREWLTSLRIKPEGPHVIHDVSGYYSTLFLGKPITPVMVLVVDDHPFMARTVPSGRQAHVVLKQLREMNDTERLTQNA